MASKRSTTGRQLLIISERDSASARASSEYPVQGRGGQGVKTLNITDRTGNVAACRVVEPGQELMLVTVDGIVVRTKVDTISLIGRNTQGVTVMRVGEGDQVASIATFTMSGPMETRDVGEVSANGNGHSDEQVLNETIPLEIDESEDADDEG